MADLIQKKKFAWLLNTLEEDLQKLALSGITEESLLDYILKYKQVDIRQMNHYIRNDLRLTSDVIGLTRKLIQKKLIWKLNDDVVSPTFKAKWQRIRDSKELAFGGIIAVIIATLIILMQVTHILK